MVHGQVGKHLAVQPDILSLNLAHEFAVVHPLGSHRRIDTLNPQRAEFPLFELTPHIGVEPTLLKRFPGNGLDISTCQEIPFGLLENLLAPPA